MTLKEITAALLQLVQHLLSWPVALVVVLLVFRKQSIELFQEVKSRLKVLQIKDYKLELSEPKTTETAIGKTNVSAIPTKFDTDSYVFRSHKFRFEISYPINAELEVIHSPEQPEFLVHQGHSLVLQLFWRQTTDAFVPNVNVIIQPVGDISITQYVAVTIQSFAQERFELDSHSVDLKTAGALFSCLSTFVIKDAKGDSITSNTIKRARVFSHFDLFGRCATSFRAARSIKFSHQFFSSVSSPVDSSCLVSVRENRQVEGRWRQQSPGKF